jgi:DNA-binding PadR family transcriptional regulator
MTTIDLIVLGMLKGQDLSAYDIQKLVEYRNISKWVKVSTPAIYKKVLQLEEKGLIEGTAVKEGKMPEKAIYSLTETGKREFEKLMLEIATQPIRIFLDFNAVIVNLDKLDANCREQCLRSIESSVAELKQYLEENLNLKEGIPDIPETGLAVLKQQYILVQSIETWLDTLTSAND